MRCELQQHSCRGARRLPGKAAHTVWKCRETWGFRQPCATCLVLGEPSRTCLVQLDCWDRPGQGSWPSKTFQSNPQAQSSHCRAWVTVVHFHVLSHDGSPCPCTPDQLPGSHIQSKPLANCCQAQPTPGEEELPCKMQDHTDKPATAQQGDLCLV